MSEAMLDRLPRVRIPVLGEAGVDGQVGPQPVERLLAEAGTFLVIEFVGVRALARGSQGSGTGGVVTVLCIQVFGQLRLGGEGIGEETDSGSVTFLVGDTEQGEFDLLLWAARLRLAREEGGQLLVQFEPPFGAAKIVTKEREIGRQLIGLAEGGDRRPQLLLLTQSDAEVVVRQGVIGLEGDGLAVGASASAGFFRSSHRIAPRLVYAEASSGWRAMALRMAATASSSFFCERRARPRLL